MYWRPGGRGYTHQKSEAGLYTHEQAEKILLDANVVKVEEIKIPAREAPEFSLDHRFKDHVNKTCVKV